MSYAFDDHDVQLWSALSGEPFPKDVIAHAANGGQLKAFNAGFEMTILSGHPGKAVGFPRTKISQWHDTAAKVAAHALPRGLGNAAMALPGIPYKDEAGKRVMLLLSKPAGLAKATPEQLETLYSYCVNDTVVERAIDRALPNLTANEQLVWELDYKINKRGLRVDLDLVHRSIALLAIYVDQKVAQCVAICGFKPSQRAKVIDWCAQQGYVLEDYTADGIKAALALPEGTVPAPVRAVLEIRQITASAAVKKYAAFALSTCNDSRIRGMFLYHGAATGRWCIAKGALVRVKRLDNEVTDIPIETVLLSDKVWDGDNWVPHEGLVAQGNKDVITWDGVTATPDHIVWTDEYTKMTLANAQRLGLQLWSGNSV